MAFTGFELKGNIFLKPQNNALYFVFACFASLAPLVYSCQFVSEISSFPSPTVGLVAISIYAAPVTASKPVELTDKKTVAGLGSIACPGNYLPLEPRRIVCGFSRRKSPAAGDCHRNSIPA